MEGRRHSVDVPISKTILALRRVRSLRDPSTTYNSKYSPSVDNLNWDTNSINAITLGFANGYDEDIYGGKHGLGLTGFGLSELKEEKPSVPELLNAPRSSNCKLTSDDISFWVSEIGSVPIETGQAVVPNHYELNRGGVFGNEPLSERYRNVYMDNDFELGNEPSGDCFEGADSCNEPLERSGRTERLEGHNASFQKTKHQKQFRSSRAAMGDIMSRVGSPCFSASHVLAESCGGTSPFGTEDVDVADYNSRGCGISCCWSGTPKLRQSNLDVEDQPLLSGEVAESVLSEKCNSWKLRNNELALYSDSPRSLAQKFRPKCFSDMVGQDIVARSLLSSLSNGRISSFYLFHGPRGTGKSCASRIFAAALNCLSLEEDRPCGLCSECVLFFSGRSKEVKEVDSLRINRRDKLRSLIKSATMSRVSSQYKVFIVDECHLLRGETWAALLNILANISQQVVFIMITPHLDKLPRAAVAQSQKYHFPKIKEIDIANQLGKICGEEGLEFEQVALNFVATKSNGSLRDAEMMLEQLSLLGKRITLSLVYEIIGIVSDDELLDLLDLALSADTSNTVKRARELMRSRIDPMQLISQLANLIMDILAGKSQEGCSEVRKKFYSSHTSEASLQQLNNALKILSEAEKQLRTSKSQTTWLTVALLQLSSGGSSFLDPNDLKCDKSIQLGDSDYGSRSSTSETLKHLVCCTALSNESHKVGMQDGKETLESIWKRATGACQSNSLRSFLQKHGKLASISFNQGLAVVELEFHNPAHVSKAEKSWKLIANSIQSVLGRNVELRINLVHCASMVKYSEPKKRSFSLFSCSRRIRRQSQSSTEHGSDPSDSSNPAATREQYVESLEACSSYSTSQHSHDCCQRKEAASIIRNNDGNALRHEHRDIHAQGGEKQPSCFPKYLKLRKKIHSPTVSQNTCLSLQPLNSLALPTPQKTPSGACSCTSDHQISFSKD